MRLITKALQKVHTTSLLPRKKKMEHYLFTFHSSLSVSTFMQLTSHCPRTLFSVVNLINSAQVLGGANELIWYPSQVIYLHLKGTKRSFSYLVWEEEEMVEKVPSSFARHSDEAPYSLFLKPTQQIYAVCPRARFHNKHWLPISGSIHQGNITVIMWSKQKQASLFGTFINCIIWCFVNFKDGSSGL